MADATDIELLRKYTRQGAEDAFAELVRRHIHLVYSAALRQTGIAAHAEEITQAVFVILAQKAGQLREGVILEAWLYQTTRLTALRFLRGERRRQLREQEASMQSHLQETASSPVWNDFAPLLDDAMSRLGEKDRQAILLRFFKEKNLDEVGAAMNITSAAAQSRVHRALEKLRTYFSKRGVNSTTEIIARTISANSIQTAPVAVAKSVTAVALAKGTTASISTSTLVKAALKIMAWTKAKTAIVTGVVLVAAIATTTLVAVKNPKSQYVSSKQKLLESASKTDADVVADRTTPRGTLLVMADAMQTGDAKTYVESCVFVTSDELKLKGLLEEFVTASARFRAAIGDKFGQKQAQAIQRQMPLALPAEFLGTADVNVTGDSATVDPFKNIAKGAKSRPFQLIKVGNEWKLKGFGLLPVEAAVWNNVIPSIITALNQTAAEIPQGRYETAANAVKTMKDRADY